MRDGEVVNLGNEAAETVLVHFGEPSTTVYPLEVAELEAHAEKPAGSEGGRVLGDSPGRAAALDVQKAATRPDTVLGPGRDAALEHLVLHREPGERALDRVELNVAAPSMSGRALAS